MFCAAVVLLLGDWALSAIFPWTCWNLDLGGGWGGARPWDWISAVDSPTAGHSSARSGRIGGIRKVFPVMRAAVPVRTRPKSWGATSATRKQAPARPLSDRARAGLGTQPRVSVSLLHDRTRARRHCPVLRETVVQIGFQGGEGRVAASQLPELVGPFGDSARARAGRGVTWSKRPRHCAGLGASPRREAWSGPAAGEGRGGRVGGRARGRGGQKSWGGRSPSGRARNSNSFSTITTSSPTTTPPPSTSQPCARPPPA